MLCDASGFGENSCVRCDGRGGWRPPDSGRHKIGGVPPKPPATLLRSIPSDVLGLRFIVPRRRGVILASCCGSGKRSKCDVEALECVCSRGADSDSPSSFEREEAWTAAALRSGPRSLNRVRPSESGVTRLYRRPKNFHLGARPLDVSPQ